MPRPDLTQLKADIAAFDDGPLAFSLDECKALRKRIYHALWYDDQGIQKMDMIDHVRLTRAIVRIKSIEEY